MAHPLCREKKEKKTPLCKHLELPPRKVAQASPLELAVRKCCKVLRQLCILQHCLRNALVLHQHSQHPRHHFNIPGIVLSTLSVTSTSRLAQVCGGKAWSSASIHPRSQSVMDNFSPSKAKGTIMPNTHPRQICRRMLTIASCPGMACMRYRCTWGRWTPSDGPPQLCFWTSGSFKILLPQFSSFLFFTKSQQGKQRSKQANKQASTQASKQASTNTATNRSFFTSCIRWSFHVLDWMVGKD